MKQQDWKLYWVWSRIVSEDCFIIAKSKIEAKEHFNEWGLNDNDFSYIFAREVMKVKIDITDETPFIPSNETLEKLGFEIIHSTEPKVFWKDGKYFKESDIFEDAFYSETEKKNGIYIFNLRDTEFYKIGKTENLVERLKSVKTNNPFEIKLIAFFECKFPRRMEGFIKKKYKLNKYKNEWYRLNQYDIGNIVGSIKTNLDKV
jgi:hypothetical protein